MHQHFTILKDGIGIPNNRNKGLNHRWQRCKICSRPGDTSRMEVKMVRGIWAAAGRKEGIQEHGVREAKSTKERAMNMAMIDRNQNSKPNRREIRPQPPQADMEHCQVSMN